MLRPGELGNKAFDAVLVPRNAQTIGDLDIHEVGADRDGRVIFVNTKYSCLATLDLTHSFRPIWKPAFISKLAPEDRCHLNGMAMADGEVRYVTAVSRSDVLSGWRERRHEGGVLIDVRDDRIVTDQLSMPHSPRVVGEQVYVLDSGRGQIVRIDPASGEKTDIAFCPGFLRGMAIHHGHAIVTLSKPRDGTFKGLLLDGELKKRDAEAWCGLMVVNLHRRMGAPRRPHHRVVRCRRHAGRGLPHVGRPADRGNPEHDHLRSALNDPGRERRSRWLPLPRPSSRFIADGPEKKTVGIWKSKIR